MSDGFPSRDAWLHHRVSYGETDAMGVVYYAEYFHLFERGRSLLIREAGMSYADVEARGIYLPVREASCRYRVPARYDNEIWIRVGIDEWKRASVRFVYEVRNAERSTLMASGHTEHACTNAEGRPVRVPEWLRAPFTPTP